MAVFGNLNSHPSLVEGGWQVALAGRASPTRIKTLLQRITLHTSNQLNINLKQMQEQSVMNVKTYITRSKTSRGPT